jgi:hypothetical protein
LRRTKNKDDSLRRINRQTIMLNHREMQALNLYCERYRIPKSEFMREAIMKTIFERFDREHPSLFEEGPNLFNQGRDEEI